MSSLLVHTAASRGIQPSHSRCLLRFVQPLVCAMGIAPCVVFGEIPHRTLLLKPVDGQSNMRHVSYAAHPLPSMTRTYQTAAAAMASSSQGAPPVAARASTPGGLSLTVATFNIGANADHMHQGLPTAWRGHVDNKNFMASNVDTLPAGQVHVQKLAWLLEGASGIPRLVACGFDLYSEKP